MNIRTRGIRKAAFALSAGLLALTSALFQATTAQAAGGWETVTQPLPIPQTVAKAQVLPVSATSTVLIERWAGCPIAGCDSDAYMFHRDGTGWQAKPAGPADQYPSSFVAGTAADDVWTFGSGDWGGQWANHWDGTAWTSRAVDTGYAFTAKDGVAPARGELLLAGSVYSGGVDRPAVRRLSGTTWTNTVLPAPAGKNTRLESMLRLAANDIWVVGETTVSTGTTEMYVARFNGTAWSQLPAPKLTAPFDYVSNTIAGTANDIWINGKQTTDGCFTTLRWDGTVWKTVPVCGAGTVNTLAKYGSDWVAGGSATFGLRKWNGTAWTPLTAPRTTGTTVTELTADPAAGALWATGTDASGFFVSRLAGPLT
ncbi:hypothetical protein ACIQUQ_17545 [Streptomyces sp. NPDC101118]|uniref:hypothetical protein n=1 Tax=Streptomyces sp. NPDC101118 TaxID=3366109 RepID=UPI0037F85E58